MSSSPTRFFCRELRLDDWADCQRVSALNGGAHSEPTVLINCGAFGGVVCTPEQKGPVIGWLSYINSARTKHRPPHEGLLLLGMLAHPEWNGLDVFRSMLSHLVDVCRLQGIPRVFSLLPDGSDETRNVLFRCGMLCEKLPGPKFRMSLEVEP